MNLSKLIALAGKLHLPELVVHGETIAKDIADFAGVLKANVARSKHVLTDGDRAELDAIHAEAIAAANALDAKLAKAAGE
ncbi:hypothetical protein [Sphingomonas sp.]|uniref:hypothetical protein n=1 Tax=Sphingomonas sp. TaxID=28214 RepID=UPI003CC5813B